MDWKIVLPILLTFMLVFSVCAGCTQQQEGPVEAIRELVDTLPTVEEFRSMTQEQQLKAYNDTQAAYDAYLALNEEQQQVLSDSVKKLEALFAYFNSQIMPISP